MQYWIRNTMAVAVALGLTGCSVFTNDAHHERNYRANKPVQVPAHLSAPYQDPTYKMDEAQYDTKVASDDLLRAPAQVLTIAQGSWVEEGDKSTRIHFDKNEGIVDLEAYIWRAIDDTLAEYDVSALSKQGNALKTDWYSVVKPVEVWFWEEEKEVSRQRFTFNVEPQEHKRTVAVSVTLDEFKAADKPLTPLLQQRLEVAALNAFVERFDFNYRKLVNELNKKRGIVSLEMGFDDKGNAAFVTEQKTDAIFERFPTFLERVGFKIDEVEAGRNLIFATYQAPDNSIWDSIWGDEVNQLPLEPGQYQLLIGKTATGGSSITWLDNQGETLEPGTMNDLLQTIVSLLRQRGVDI